MSYFHHVHDYSLLINSVIVSDARREINISRFTWKSVIEFLSRILSVHLQYHTFKILIWITKLLTDNLGNFHKIDLRRSSSATHHVHM